MNQANAPIMLARASHLLSFTDVLNGIGAPVDHELASARLPTLGALQGDTYLPARNVLAFIDRMERLEGIVDIAFLVWRESGLDRLNGEVLSQLGKAPTLRARILRFGQLSAVENTYSRFSMWCEGDATRLCINLIDSRKLPALRHSEWVQLSVLIDIIRVAAGASWCPLEMTFQSDFRPGEEVCEHLSRTRLRVGQRNTSILVPTSILNSLVNVTTMGCESDTPARFSPNFPQSLKLALQSYLADGYPEVTLAAELSNTSVRTLQRRLKQYAMTYSTLVQQARFEVAVKLLEDPCCTSIDVAYAVGYSDPSHFARAFRQCAGLSPQAYRRQAH